MISRDQWPLASDETWWPWPGAPGGAGEVLLREYPGPGAFWVEARVRHFEQPIGYANLWPYAGRDRVEVVHLVVEPAWRRRGLGRALAAYVEHWARKQGYELITLDAYAESAQMFWQAIGYVPERPRSNRYEKRLEGRSTWATGHDS